MSDPDPVQPTGTTPPPPPPHTPPLSSRTDSRVVTTIALVGLLVVVLLAAGWWFYGGVNNRAAPEQAANAFFKTNADDGPSAAYVTTTGTFRDGIPQSGWIATSQRLRLGAFYSAEWTSNERMDDTASLRGKVLRLNSPSLSAAVDLRRIDGVWKVAQVTFDDAAAANAAPSYSGVSGATQPSGLTPPAPVASVPRFGEGSQQVAAAPPPPTSGRAGPPGTSLPSGQVGPECQSILWKAGYRSNKVACPLYLPTNPGSTEQCTAYGLDGSTAGVTVTFLDYDPIARRGTFDCRLNG